MIHILAEKDFILIATILFLTVSMIHSLKLYSGFNIQIAGRDYPTWLSFLEFMVAIFLVFQGFVLWVK